MTYPNTIHRHIIRTLLALCRLAQNVSDAEVVTDISDEAILLLEGVIVGSDADRANTVVQWCSEISPVIDHCVGDEAIVARAKLEILRLRVAAIKLLPKELVAHTSASKNQKKKPAPQITRPVRTVLGTNQKTVMAWVTDHTESRSKDIIAHFSGKISERTVKRVLKDLVDQGVLYRVQEGGTLFYRTLDPSKESAI